MSHYSRGSSTFPAVRLRRLRGSAAMRRLVGRPSVRASDLILPLFVRDGEGPRRPIRSLPGHDQLTLEHLAEEGRQAVQLGLGGVILFGIPRAKDADGSDALSDQGIIAQAVRTLKQEVPELLVVTDLCFCEYTDHGHCGVLREHGESADVDNDLTLPKLAQQAVIHARAGADILAPSGMMDGMVQAIRHGLDQAEFTQVPIMSYSAKYASSFYGPFRDAADSAPLFGDRRSYQMDPQTDGGQALREIEQDLFEGADMIMVKPALAYLDIIRQAADRFPGVPLAAYNVSGEYSMIHAAAQAGWLDLRAAALESLHAIQRAGAQIVITYWAKQVARWEGSCQSSVVSRQ